MTKPINSQSEALSHSLKAFPMTSKTSIVSWLLLLGLCCTTLVGAAARSFDDDRQTYIVYMGDRPKDEISGPSRHRRMLREVLGSHAQKSLLHTYKRSFSGFAAKLTRIEMQRVAAMDGVVSVFPSEKKQLHTTRSWDFMGFSLQVNRSTVESDIIIGMLDSGIWPESASFNDTGFGPAPSKWKGSCQTINVTCNNKFIGAKYYKSDQLFGPNDIVSPRDSNGHGTHTSSTAGGGLVGSTSLMGLGLGTVRGGVPSARIAAYKVCWSDGCDDADILAAFDDAIADGVDIISASLGGSTPQDYFNNSLAIGSFHAMKNGILTSISAGNAGPNLATTVNVSPWTISVAASTIDRDFVTNVQLGDSTTYAGVSLNVFNSSNGVYPLIYAGNAPNTAGGFNSSSSSICLPNSLDPTLVTGKIVLCDGVNNGQAPFVAGAAGVLLDDGGPMDVAWPYPLPAANLAISDYSSVYTYLLLDSNPNGTIFMSTEGNDTSAPYIASFSSRGPNPVTPDIMKPDIAAPGVDILAATSPLAPLSGVEGDSRRAFYNFDTGTSMACPHVTGVAAYVKSFNPTWSPAAIKSAIMTTAFPMSVDTSPDGEFGYGAGHVNPLQAVAPGLVYDAYEADYVNFLCGQGYNNVALQKVTGDNSTCSPGNSGTVWDLNLPSFALSVSASQTFSQSFNRTVTNVGSATSTYQANLTAPPGLTVEVRPGTLSFTAVGQQLQFVLTVLGTLNLGDAVSGSLVWDDGTYKVRSPIVVYSYS